MWFGGAIGGAIAVGLWAWRRKMLNLTLLDICAVPLAVGYALGRIGCQVSGDGDYGKAWDGPWAMAYPHGTKPIDTPVQPTPIYETLAMGLVAYFLWRLRDRVQPGVLFAITWCSPAPSGFSWSSSAATRRSSSASRSRS